MNRYLAARIVYFGLLRQPTLINNSDTFHYDLIIQSSRLRKAQKEYHNAFDALLIAAYPTGFTYRRLVGI